MKFREKIFMAVALFFSTISGIITFSYCLNLINENDKHDFGFYMFAFVISAMITIFLFNSCYIVWKDFLSENGEIQ